MELNLADLSSDLYDFDFLTNSSTLSSTAVTLASLSNTIISTNNELLVNNTDVKLDSQALEDVHQLIPKVNIRYFKQSGTQLYGKHSWYYSNNVVTVELDLCDSRLIYLNNLDIEDQFLPRTILVATIITHLLTEFLISRSLHLLKGKQKVEILQDIHDIQEKWHQKLFSPLMTKLLNV